ncbi:MAG: ATP-binding cassette domain-containing protein, partial [Ilumatobacteraceae bacterium]
MSFATARGLVRAVDGVSFALAPGRTLGIVGESGSGKSVLCQAVMGLLPQRNLQQSGSVTFAGLDLRGMKRRSRRRLWGAEMAIVFQDPMTSLSPVLTVGRQVTDAVRYHLKMSRRASRRHAVELLRSLGIPDPQRRLGE